MIKSILLVILISIGLFFSFYHLPEHYVFEYDREGNYNSAKTIVVDRKFTLIGPAVHSTIYLGPWVYYFQVPFFVALRGDPIYGAYLMATVNFAVFLLIYIFLKQTSRSQLVAICGALLWVSSATRFNDLVTFAPLFGLIFLVFYERFHRKKDLRSLFFLTLTWSLSLNVHPQMVFLGPVWLYGVILSLASRKPRPLRPRMIDALRIFFPWRETHGLPGRGVSFFRRHKKSWLKPGLILLVALFLPILPVILFDFRHDFPVLRAVTSFLTKETAPIKTSTAPSGFRLIYSLRQFSPPIALPLDWLNHNPLFSVLLLSLGALFVSLKKRLFYLLLIPLTSVLLMSSYQQKTWPEYYHLIGGLSLLLLLLIAAAETKVTKLILVFLTVVIVLSNFRYLISYADPLSYFYKKQVILYMLSENKPYDKMNIINDFPFGEGLGFGPIREFYERKDGQYPPLLKFFVSYQDNPKHNQTKKVFGAFAVSKIYE